MNNTALDYTTGTPWLDCDLDGNVTEETKVSLKKATDAIEAIGSIDALTDYFLNFYGITEGDGMYLAPEDRVLIW